jgi:hypothetical protein
MMEVNMKPNNKNQMFEFLLTADFNHDCGYSYLELIDYLDNYKNYFRSQNIDKENIKRDLERSEKENRQLLERIKILESKIEIQSNQLKNIKTTLSRKLSVWERISGKIKF